MGRCSRAPAAAAAAAGGPSWRSGRWWQQFKTRRGRSLFAAAGCRRNLGAPPPQVEGWGWGVRRDPATSAAPVPLRSPPAPVPASPGLPRSRFTAPPPLPGLAALRAAGVAGTSLPAVPPCLPPVSPPVSPPRLSRSLSPRGLVPSLPFYISLPGPVSAPLARVDPSPSSKDFSLARGVNQVTRKRTGRRAGAHALHVATARGPAARPGPRRGPPLLRSPAGGAEGLGQGARTSRSSPGAPQIRAGGRGVPGQGRIGAPWNQPRSLGLGRPHLPPRDPREPGWGCAQRARRPYLRPWRDQPGCAPPAPPAAVGPGSAFAGGSGFLVPAAPRVNH